MSHAAIDPTAVPAAAPRDVRLTTPWVMTRLDGWALMAGSLVAYHLLGGSWWLFGALFLAPDLFMLGYLRDTRVGAVIYNVGHTWAVPVAFGIAAALLWSPLLAQLGVIWAFHLAMDRSQGYGFKYASAFTDTHLGRV